MMHEFFDFPLSFLLLSQGPHAGAGAAAITCGPASFAEADVYVTTKALAEATAIAISEVYVSCKADTGAYACADAGTFITDAAHAVAAVRNQRLLSHLRF